MPDSRKQELWIIDALQAALARDGKEGLSRQLARLLRQWIGSGRLAGDSRLPASRDLARSLGLGRNTVLDAYEQLQAEGYIATRAGSGSYVTRLFAPPAPEQPAPARGQPLGLSQRGHELFATSGLPVGLFGAFAPGVPEIRQFPHHAWQQLLSRQQRRATAEDLCYCAGGGLPALREALADYLQLSRGVRCRPEQIIVTQGAQQALELAARLLADPGDVAWVEEPGYVGAHAAMRGAALQLVPAPVDHDGLNPALVADARPPKLIYTTPSHQYPSGVVMSLPRRLALLAAAQQHGAWIIEDDYDSEFRYVSQPQPALQGLAQDERVIYVGTLAKVMYPGLRVGYLVVPDALIDPFRGCNARLYREGPLPVQAALAEFFSSGLFARHVRRMRELYRERQHCLRSALAASGAEHLALSPGEAGLHLVATLPPDCDEDALSAAAARQQVWLRPLSRHYLAAPQQRGFVLGYAGVDEAAIRHGVAVMAQVLNSKEQA
ncbi:PLP-dependent aminotransferase family protein [Vogesella sp. LIG4]|uniref:MocR-like pyridoxine biosynthesis transcription factor PdxR n=1 Tax=Vogesella sp. LIG4 TaxID=1192162 RepID=UPI00081FB008|nr:PLP-dependent aminotransferase family protein [Vogesella sp. LIG4]SCK16076.1 GntR family transcriptional regulator / MocR family aminotransferase [Vogesella sp. LIG4]